MKGTLSERAIYILGNYPELMTSIVDKILGIKDFTLEENKLLQEIIEKFKK